VFEAPWDFSLA
jgi:hypothetical protein